MVSDVSLPRDPVDAMHATTKQYVDQTLESIKDSVIAELKKYVDDALADIGSGGGSIQTEPEVTGSETAVPTSAAIQKYVEESLPKMYQLGESDSPSKLTQAKVGDFYYQKTFQGKVTVGYLADISASGKRNWLLISRIGG